jgi:hypothetical protein
MRQTEASKQFFFAKKNQKTLVYKALALPRRVGPMDKIFCIFLQKELLSSCRCVSLKANWYKPECRRTPQPVTEAQGGVAGDGPLAVDDLRNPVRRNQAYTSVSTVVGDNRTVGLARRAVLASSFRHRYREPT